jgi:hypothetical protein
VLIERWRRTYNQAGPHSSLSYRLPAPVTIMPGQPELTWRVVHRSGAGHLDDPATHSAPSNPG